MVVKRPPLAVKEGKAGLQVKFALQKGGCVVYNMHDGHMKRTLSGTGFRADEGKGYLCLIMSVKTRAPKQAFLPADIRTYHWREHSSWQIKHTMPRASPCWRGWRRSASARACTSAAWEPPDLRDRRQCGGRASGRLLQQGVGDPGGGRLLHGSGQRPRHPGRTA